MELNYHVLHVSPLMVCHILNSRLEYGQNGNWHMNAIHHTAQEIHACGVMLVVLHVGFDNCPCVPRKIGDTLIDVPVVKHY